MKKLLIAFLIVVTFPLLIFAEQNAKEIKHVSNLHLVTTIVPLKYLAESVLGDKFIITALLDDQHSMHEQSLRYDQMSIINSADILLWLSSEHEKIFNAITLSPDQIAIEIDKIKNITLLPERSYRYMSNGDFNIAYDSSRSDVHSFLDLENVKLIARHIAKAGINLDPENEKTYKANLDRFIKKLNRLQDDTRAEYSIVPDVDIVLLHDFLQYHQEEFDVKIFAIVEEVHGNINIGERVFLDRLIDRKSSKTCIVYDNHSSTSLIDEFRMLEGMNLVELEVEHGLDEITKHNRDNFIIYYRNIVKTLNTCYR